MCRLLHNLDTSVLIQAPCSVISDVVSSCASHLSCTIKNFVDTTLMLSIIYASFVPKSLCLQRVIHEYVNAACQNIIVHVRLRLWKL